MRVPPFLQLSCQNIRAPPSESRHARTCMKAHEKSPQIYGYLDYSTNSPACQLVFSINFHITFINPRLCEACPAEKPFFQGEFYGAGQGQNARRGRKGCKKCFDHCPVKAITMTPTKKGGIPKAKFDYNKCIRCYCCQELCPFGLVRVKAGIV